MSEKVGTAITMSHLAVKATLFVGTGQKYHNKCMCHLSSKVYFHKFIFESENKH